MAQQLQEMLSDSSQRRSRLDNAEQARLAAETARDEAIARIAELERSLVSGNERLQEDADCWSMRLRQIKAVLAAFASDSFEADGELDLVERVRCLVQTLQEKSSVRFTYRNTELPLFNSMFSHLVLIKLEF